MCNGKERKMGPKEPPSLIYPSSTAFSQRLAIKKPKAKHFNGETSKRPQLNARAHVVHAEGRASREGGHEGASFLGLESKRGPWCRKKQAQKPNLKGAVADPG